MYLVIVYFVKYLNVVIVYFVKYLNVDRGLVGEHP
jgi:hypothetical protein